FERAVIEIVRTPLPDRLSVGIGELGLSNQDLVGDGSHGAEFTVLARRDGAWNPQPFADITVFADALPDLGGRAVDGDFQRNRDVSRLRDHDADGRGWRSLRRRRRSLCGAGARKADDRQRTGGCSCSQVISHTSLLIVRAFRSTAPEESRTTPAMA